MRNLVYKSIPFLIIIITIAAVFSPYLVGYVGITPHVGTNDNTDTQIPFRKVLQENIRQGTLPLWEPRISAGFPLFAEGQIGSLHPLNLLFASLPVPPYYSLSLSIITTIIISAIGMYLFSLNWLKRRNLGESTATVISVFAALVWGLNGFHLNHVAHLNNINVMSMLPWQLLIIDSLIYSRSKVLGCIIGYATTIALQIVSGHPQFTAYSIIFNILYYLANIFLLQSKEKATIIAKSIIALVLAGSLGVCIGMMQLLPTYEFTQNSTRQEGLSEESANFLSFRLKDFPTFFAPFYDFNHEPRTPARLAEIGWPFDERYSYIGLLPIILALIALPFILKDRTTIIFTILGIFFLLLSLGNQSPIGFLLRTPPLNMFRLPAKFTVFFQFSLAILATSMLAFLCTKYLKGKAIIITITIITLLTVVDTGSKLYKLYPLVKGEMWYSKPKTVEVYENITKEFGDKEIIPVLGQNYNDLLQKQYFEDDLSLWDEKQTEIFKNNREVLPAFNMLVYNVPLLTNAINSAGLKVKWYSDIESKLFFTPLNDSSKYNSDYWKLAKLAGAKYLLHDELINDDKAELIAKTDFSTGQSQVGVYRLKEVLPFLQTMSAVKLVDSNQTFTEIQNDNFNPETDLILSENAPIIENSENNNSFSIINNKPGEINVSANIESPGYLLIRQAYYPGWKAFLNDTEIPIYRANHAFQSVYVDVLGQSTLKFVYKPTSIQIGRKISLVGTAIYVALLFVSLYKRLKSSHAQGIPETSRKSAS